MRRTGSRESRERRDASATSPTSMAVKTFSIRFGSRRIQRPTHQKIRSMTTVTPMIDTNRIGHMTGPPLRKLSIRKFSCDVLFLTSGAAPAAGERVAVIAGEPLGAIVMGEPTTGAPGAMLAPGGGAA